MINIRSKTLYKTLVRLKVYLCTYLAGRVMRVLGNGPTVNWHLGSFLVKEVVPAQALTIEWSSLYELQTVLLDLVLQVGLLNDCEPSMLCLVHYDQWWVFGVAYCSFLSTSTEKNQGASIILVQSRMGHPRT